MRSNAMAAALAALALTAPAAAASFRVELQGDRILRARNGTNAADSRTATALVRVISPGSTISRKGTVRVLVMNLGPRPFTFGPENVTVSLSDGTAVAVVTNQRFRRAARIVEQETARRNSVNARVSRNMSALAQGASAGVTPQVPVSTPSAGTTGAHAASRLDRRGDPDAPPGLLEAIDGMLRSTDVAPQQAAGGYLMFELPQHIRGAKSDQQITFTVTVAGEEHRFPALLDRR